MSISLPLLVWCFTTNPDLLSNIRTTDTPKSAYFSYVYALVIFCLYAFVLLIIVFWLPIHLQ